MSNEASGQQVDALATLALLEIRLRRLEFLLTGSSDLDGRPTPVPASKKPLQSRDTVAGQLQQLQEDLDKLRKASGPAGDLIRDVESLHSKTPEIFTDPTPRQSSSLADQTTHIFANTSLYTETASRLSSLQALQIPPAEQSSQYTLLRPRIDAAAATQERLEAEARRLRERSAQCLEWWVNTGVVGMGELWSDWDERVREVERNTSRLEKVKAHREGYI